MTDRFEPTTPPEPAAAELTHPRVDGTRAVVLWDFDTPRATISSAPVGGGSAAIDWLVNIGVTGDYSRTDLGTHAGEVAHRLGCSGTGAALFTAVDPARLIRVENEGVVADATVGVTRPTWAADGDGHAQGEGGRWDPGTINVVVQVPAALSPAAAVNAIATVTEAKTQALFEAGIPGTGTASDAVAVCWPPILPVHPFAGPRSTWGTRIAGAVHEAVARGLREGDGEGR